MIDLKIGMKCYASNLSLHAKGMEFKYKPPRGKRFAVILMGDEKPDNLSGMSCDDFLRNAGWELCNGSFAVPEAIITAPLKAMNCGPSASYVMGWNDCRNSFIEEHGEVVVIKNDKGDIVSVTRQDKEGKILSVIAEAGDKNG